MRQTRSPSECKASTKSHFAASSEEAGVKPLEASTGHTDLRLAVQRRLVSFAELIAATKPARWEEWVPEPDYTDQAIAALAERQGGPTSRTSRTRSTMPRGLRHGVNLLPVRKQRHSLSKCSRVGTNSS